MPKTKKRQKHHLKRVLTPSRTSGITTIVSAIAVTALLLIIFMTNAGTLQQQLISWHPSEPTKSLTLPGQELPQNDQPSLVGSWPLMLIWALVGLVLYGFASYIVHTFTRATQFKQTYQYVSSLPSEVFAGLVRQIELRCIATIIFLGLGYLFVTQLIPYIILLARAGASDSTSVSGILMTAAIVALLTTGLHILTVFARLSLGKTRILSQ